MDTERMMTVTKQEADFILVAFADCCAHHNADFEVCDHLTCRRAGDRNGVGGGLRRSDDECDGSEAIGGERWVTSTICWAESWWWHLR